MAADLAENSSVSRRAFLHGMVATGITLQTSNSGSDADSRVTFRPNIVYLHSHDSGRYLSPYGHSVPTPNLQRLAQEGTLFRKAFSAAPTCTPEDRADYCPLPRPIPDTAATRGDFARYRASARVMDEGVGKVLEAIDRNGYGNNTLIISTTDHGISFPRMKCNLTDDGWGVSLILRGPRVPRASVCDALISQVDVFPSLCDYLGIEHPTWLQGKSFLPVLAGKLREINERIFAEVNYHASYEPKRAVRTSRYKYIRRFGDKRTPVLPNCDDSPSKDLWMQAGWGSQVLDTESLYDLLFDPKEHANLIDDPAHATTAQDMRARLHDWMVATNDPLLHGPVAAPPGAVANDPDGISPEEPTVAAHPS